MKNIFVLFLVLFLSGCEVHSKFESTPTDKVEETEKLKATIAEQEQKLQEAIKDEIVKSNTGREVFTCVDDNAFIKCANNLPTNNQYYLSMSVTSQYIESCLRASAMERKGKLTEVHSTVCHR